MWRDTEGIDQSRNRRPGKIIIAFLTRWESETKMIGYMLKEDETIIDFIIWMIKTSKKYGFTLYKFPEPEQNGNDINILIDEPIEFKLSNVLTTEDEIEPTLLFLVERDKSKTDGTIRGHVAIYKDDELGAWRAEIFPCGYLGLRTIDPLIDDFAKDWLKVVYKKNMKNRLDEKNEFEDRFEVENKTIEDFNNWIKTISEKLNIMVINRINRTNRNDKDNYVIWDVIFDEREYKIQPDGFFHVSERGKNLSIHYSFSDIFDEIDFSKIITQINNDWSPIEKFNLKYFLATNENSGGRPKKKEDIEAWKRVNIDNQPKKQVFTWWVSLSSVIARDLSDPERQFSRIIKPDYIKPN